ncbi:MAG: PQQ-binding-like beta-propeller repeat protein, partial [Woeseia sp.]
IALGPDFRLVSIDAAFGTVNWELVLPPLPGAIPKRGILAADGKVFLNVGPRLFALDSETGKATRSFASGSVYSGPSRVPPFLYGRGVYVLSIDGFLRGFDIETGELLAEISYRSDSHPGYASIPWSGVALDAENGLAFFGTGNPKPDLVGISRPGSNEGANTLLAIDLDDERVAWSFQEVQHDLWDYDIASPPVLANIQVSDTEELRLVIIATKTGNVLIFDRQSGANLHDIEWVSVDTSTSIPNEYVSPVQINSALPERLIRIEYLEDDYSEGDPDEVRGIRDFLASANLGFYPPHQIGKTTVAYGIHGGAEWPGSTVNYDKGFLFTPVNHTPWKLRVDPTTRVKYESLSEEFRVDWSDEYQEYIANCGGCHTEKRSGVNIRSREKEVAYTPSLIGFSLWRGDTAAFKSAVGESHGDKDFDSVDLSRMYSFFSSWDEELDRINAIEFSGGWSYFLTNKGNFATDLAYGKVVATNILTGKIEWQSFPGETALYNSVRKGKSMFGGLAASDDGLLYVTGSDDNNLYVLDQDDGAILESHALPAAGSAPPTLLSIDGRTSVAILATGGKFYNYTTKGASLSLYQH